MPSRRHGAGVDRDAVSERPKLEPDRIKRYGEKLTRFAEWLAAEHCPLTFHHHMGTVIEVEEEIDLLMESTDKAVGLLLDTGHLTFAGGDVVGVTERGGTASTTSHQGHPGRRPEEAQGEDWSFLKGVLEGVFTVPATARSTSPPS